MQLPPALEPYREACIATAKPSATFKAKPAPAGLDPKSSRMGGVPFTPLNTNWPCSVIAGNSTNHYRPQAFVGQFNFAEIVTAVPELLGIVPDRGLLQFFYDMEENVWGLKYPGDDNFFTMLWYPNIDELTHVPAPPAVESYPAHAAALEFSYRFSLPYALDLPESIELPEEL